MKELLSFSVVLFPVRTETPRCSDIIISIVTCILFDEMNSILFIDFNLALCDFYRFSSIEILNSYVNF